MRRAHSLPGIEVASVAAHIGSQLTELAPFREAFRRLRDLVLMLRADGIVLPASISAAAWACLMTTNCRPRRPTMPR